MFEPAILSASCYLWKPNPCYKVRRDSERRKLAEVRTYFEWLGFTVTSDRRSHPTATMAHPVYGVVTVGFSYTESDTAVYKGLSVTRDGKKVNIRIIRLIHENNQQRPNQEF